MSIDGNTVLYVILVFFGFLSALQEKYRRNEKSEKNVYLAAYEKGKRIATGLMNVLNIFDETTEDKKLTEEELRAVVKTLNKYIETLKEEEVI